MGRTFTLACRVYYEDTDAGGIVYYANYLRFLERARTEALRTLGYSQEELLRQRLAFAVRALQVDYLKSARLDDLLHVHTCLESLGRAQLMFSQCIEREGVRLIDAKIRIACIDPVAGKPMAIPRAMHTQLSLLLEPTP